MLFLKAGKVPGLRRLQEREECLTLCCYSETLLPALVSNTFYFEVHQIPEVQRKVQNPEAFGQAVNNNQDLWMEFKFAVYPLGQLNELLG